MAETSIPAAIHMRFHCGHAGTSLDDADIPVPVSPGLKGLREGVVEMKGRINTHLTKVIQSSHVAAKGQPETEEADSEGDDDEQEDYLTKIGAKIPRLSGARS